FGLCGNACLIETIDLLAQKVYGIRSYANAYPESLDRARRDHLDMIKALRNARRDDLIALTRRHLRPLPRPTNDGSEKPGWQAHSNYSGLLTRLIRGSAFSVRLR